MSQIWRWIRASCFGGCIAVTVVAAGSAVAQSDQSRDDDDQQTSESESKSRDSDREDRDRRQARERSESDDEQSRDRDGDRDNVRRSQRDQYRGAPRIYDRESSRDGESEEQGGLGVSVVDDERGVRVTRVYGDTPAEEMGLRPGDRITHVDGHEVESARQFIGRIRDMAPGEEVELDILRNQQERSISGELDSRRDAVVQNQKGGQIRSDEDDQGRDRSDARDRLYALERQLDQLRREIQQLKASLGEDSDRDSRSARESTASYEERRQWDDESYPERQSRYEGSTRIRERLAPRRRAQPNVDRSPGGETGEDRLHPGSNQLNER